MGLLFKKDLEEIRRNCVDFVHVAQDITWASSDCIWTDIHCLLHTAVTAVINFDLRHLSFTFHPTPLACSIYVGTYARHIPTKPIRAVSMLKQSANYIDYPLQHWSALYCLTTGTPVAVHAMKVYVDVDL